MKNNQGEIQGMHLNANAVVPLILRVCLGLIPSPHRDKTWTCRWHFLGSGFHRNKCWCMGWKGTKAYFHTFPICTARVPWAALPRACSDTVSEIKQQWKVTWLHSVQTGAPLAVLILGSSLQILQNSETEKFPNVGLKLIWMLLRQKMHSI